MAIWIVSRRWVTTTASFGKRRLPMADADRSTLAIGTNENVRDFSGAAMDPGQRMSLSQNPGEAVCSFDQATQFKMLSECHLGMGGFGQRSLTIWTRMAIRRSFFT